jgi:hypothetical protein
MTAAAQTEPGGSLRELAALGIDVSAIGAQLERDGVERFRRRQDHAVESVAATISRLSSRRGA